MGDKVKEASVDSRLLYKRLAELAPGQIITYAELSAIIGRDVQGDARSYLNTARRMVEREDGKAFGCIINEGLKCLIDKEIIVSGSNAVTRIRKFSKRAARRFTCIADMASLPNEERIKMNATASILGAIAFIGKASNVSKIEAAVAETKEQLPYLKTMEAFR